MPCCMFPVYFNQGTFYSGEEIKVLEAQKVLFLSALESLLIFSLNKFLQKDGKMKKKKKTTMLVAQKCHPFPH